MYKFISFNLSIILISIVFLDPAVSILRKEQHGKYGSQVSDDEPLYDSVASDDDYALTSSDNPVPEYSTQFKMDNEVHIKLF